MRSVLGSSPSAPSHVNALSISLLPAHNARLAWLRSFFTYVVPAIFLNYYPALYFLDKSDPLGLPAWAPLMGPVVGFGMLCVALLFWRFGVRHYQSTGT